MTHVTSWVLAKGLWGSLAKAVDKCGSYGDVFFFSIYLHPQHALLGSSWPVALQVTYSSGQNAINDTPFTSNMSPFSSLPKSMMQTKMQQTNECGLPFTNHKIS